MSLFSVAATAAGITVNDTPVERVITLLNDLLTKTKDEGTKEQTVYEKYSCFCKEKSTKKSDEIKDEQTAIDADAAQIEDQVGVRETKIAEIAEHNANVQRLEKEMREEKARHLKERTHREAVIADLEKANNGLDGAINAVKESKPAALITVRKTIQKNLLIAEALGMASAAKVKSFLQRDDGDRYGFHSDGIMDTLNQLKTEFSDKLEEADGENTKANNAHEELMTAKTDNKTAEQKSSDDATTAKDEAIIQIGEAQKRLNDNDIELTNAQAYLKDLTEQCELKAREWDQRSGLRAGEIGALEKAIDIMTNTVKGKDQAANKRAFLNQNRSVVRRVDEDVNDSDVGDLSFVQTSSTRKSVSLLKVANRRMRTVTALQKKAQRMGNQALFNFAARLQDGPFDKVKKLIAELIERLLTEAANEATQKGWCDTELAKARKERDYKKADIESLNTDLEEWEAKRDQSKENMDRLEVEIKDLEDALEEATNNRDAEKDTNAQTLEDAHDGFKAVSEAMKVLKDFYKGEHGAGGANSATVSLIQASPVADDAPEVHSGAYQGNQAEAGGIIGILEVIQSDFKHTIDTTKTSEAESHKAFTKFKRTSLASKSGSSTDLTNNTNTHEKMLNNIKVGMNDLKDLTDLMDSAVKTLEELKPACIDTGMSYAERVAKRDEEIEALKTALCQLDPDNVETDCP